MEQRKFKEGDCVKRSDADGADNVPAYRDMRGTVTGFDWTYVLVKWDCDVAAGFHDATRMKPEWLVLAEE